MNERIETLNRNIARNEIIISLWDAILGCDETELECDVCRGLRQAIKIAESKIQPID